MHVQPVADHGGVGQEEGDPGLDQQCPVHGPVVHALLDQRVPAGLHDQKVGPLGHHNGNEEGRLAGRLQNLALVVGLKTG